MTLSNALLASMLTLGLSTSSIGSAPIKTLGNAYEDFTETTSFEDAEEMTFKNWQIMQVYGIRDTYDYCKFTAKYSRCFFFVFFVSDNLKGTADVFIESQGLDKPIYTYHQGEGATEMNVFFLHQGDTVYFRIRCQANCRWEGSIYLTPNPSGMYVYDFKRMHGYSIPHQGPAKIYYSYSESAFQEVYDKITGETFVYKDLIEEAVALWESCGNVDFVFDDLRSNFRVEFVDIPDVQVDYKYYKISENVIVTGCNISNNLDLYQAMSDIYFDSDGNPASYRANVLGLTIAAFGYVLGLVERTEADATYNMMAYPFQPFGGTLGDSDIFSFIMMWGDAYLNDE